MSYITAQLTTQRVLFPLSIVSTHHHLNLVPSQGPSAFSEHAGSSGHAGLEVDESLLLQVGELARATGKTVRAIHLYESMGLIQQARRSKGRYRLFAPEAKGRIEWINKLQLIGLSLTEIQTIVQQRKQSDSASRAARELKDVYSAKLEDVRREMAKLRGLEAELEASLSFLETCAADCCRSQTLDGCASCSHGSAGMPSLVVGARIR